MAKTDNGIRICQGLLILGNVVIGVSEVGHGWVVASLQYDTS